MRETTPIDGAVSVARDRITARAIVASAHAARAARGHFPGEPLLPGSALLELMELVARSLRDPDDRLAAVERALFRRRVSPDDRIVVTAERRDAARVAAAVLTGGAEAATGLLRFERRA